MKNNNKIFGVIIGIFIVSLVTYGMYANVYKKDVMDNSENEMMDDGKNTMDDEVSNLMIDTSGKDESKSTMDYPDINSTTDEMIVNDSGIDDTENMSSDGDPILITEKVEDAMMDTEESTIKRGQYIEYNEELVKNSKGDIVLFFHADWCPTCKIANDNFSTQMIPKGLTLLKTDYDSNLDLRRKYGLTYQHTFVQVDNEGNLIKKWSGSTDIKQILEKLN